MNFASDPAACAEVASLHDAYERALVANDIDSLNAYFWTDPAVIRFGIREQSYGPEAIAHYRQAARPPQPERRILRRSVVSFGSDVVSVMCEIAPGSEGAPRLVRQSQLWVRFPEAGWKITSAHVSQPVETGHPWAAYAAQTAVAVGLPLRAEELSVVGLHLERAAAIADPLLAHAVPDSVERAPVFTA